MDLSDTIAPTSDQLDAVDLLSGPRTFTIKAVSRGNAEQPVNIVLAEFPRVWRPGKSMRRVLVACWGADASTYAGRRVTLYCDPTVRFGGQEVGGTRISHLSHLDKPKQVPLLVTRGKSAMFVVRPLVEAPTVSAITAEQWRRLGALLKEVDATKQLRITVQLVKREIASPKELTETEASELIRTLEDLADQGPLGEMLDALLSAAEQAPAGDVSQLRDDDPDLTAHLGGES